MSREILISDLKGLISFNSSDGDKVLSILECLAKEEEEVTHKEEIRVDGLGVIENNSETLSLLEVVDFRIKNLLMSDLHSIHIRNSTLSELVKLREQLRP